MSILSPKVTRFFVAGLLMFLSSPIFAWSFLKNEISVGYSNRHSVSFHCPRPPSPIFWEATTKMDRGGTLMYQRLLYHNRKRFSLYLGLGISHWVRDPEALTVESVFFSLRYWFIRAQDVSLYFSYSVVGPTILSRRFMNNEDLGSVFIFQDYLGLGLQWGRRQAFNVDVRLLHYSNGDIFPHNPGFDVPIVFYLGYSF